MNKLNKVKAKLNKNLFVLKGYQVKVWHIVAALVVLSIIV